MGHLLLLDEDLEYTEEEQDDDDEMQICFAEYSKEEELIGQ